MNHSYWVHMLQLLKPKQLEPMLCNKRSHQFVAKLLRTESQLYKATQPLVFTVAGEVSEAIISVYMHVRIHKHWLTFDIILCLFFHYTFCGKLLLPVVEHEISKKLAHIMYTISFYLSLGSQPDNRHSFTPFIQL